MKKRMLLFGLLFALVLPAFAQLGTVKDYRHEISLGYGFLAVSGTDFDLDYPYYREVDNIGAFFAPVPIETELVRSDLQSDRRDMGISNPLFNFAGFQICRNQSNL